MFIPLRKFKTLSGFRASLTGAVIILAVGSASHAHADIVSSSGQNMATEQSATTVMTMAQIDARLWQHPALMALSFSAEANRERAVAARGLPDPQVSLQLNNFPLLSPSFTEYLPTNRSVGFQQSFPSRAERDAKSHRSYRNADQVAAERAALFDNYRGRVIALLRARSALATQHDIARARNEKYDELLAIIEIEINAGRPLLFRLAQVDFERADVFRTIADLDMQRATIDAELTELLGGVPQVTLADIAKTPWPPNALSLHAVRVADAGVDMAQADIAIAKADFKPDWGANVTYQQRESGKGRANFDGDDWVSGGVTFTVPLWAGQRQDPALRAAKADLSAARARRSATARRVRSDWQRLNARADVAAETMEVLQTQLTATLAQTAAQLTAYEAGEGDYSAIIDGEIAVLRLQAALIKDAVRRDQAIAMMNSLLVTP